MTFIYPTGASGGVTIFDGRAYSWPSEPRPRRKRNHPTQQQRRLWREDTFRRARCR